MRKYSLITVLFFSLVACGYHNKPELGKQINWSHPLSKNLVGMWLLNEGSGDITHSVGLYPELSVITMTNGTWKTGSCGVGLNLNSNSNDRIQSGKPISELIHTTGSACILFDSESEIAVGSGDAPLFHNTGSDDYFRLCRYDSDTNLIFACNDDGTSTREFTVPDLWDGNTHFVVVTWDWNTDDIFCYVDGILVDSDNSSYFEAPVSQTGSYLNIGGDSLATNTISGTVQLVSIYNKVLSASEVAQLYRELFCMFRQNTVEQMYVESEESSAAKPQIIICRMIQKGIGVLAFLAFCFWYVGKEQLTT